MFFWENIYFQDASTCSIITAFACEFSFLLHSLTVSFLCGRLPIFLLKVCVSSSSRGFFFFASLIGKVSTLALGFSYLQVGREKMMMMMIWGTVRVLLSQGWLLVKTLGSNMAKLRFWASKQTVLGTGLWPDNFFLASGFMQEAESSSPPMMLQNQSPGKNQNKTNNSMVLSSEVKS